MAVWTPRCPHRLGWLGHNGVLLFSTDSAAFCNAIVASLRNRRARMLRKTTSANQVILDSRIRQASRRAGMTGLREVAAQVDALQLVKHSNRMGILDSRIRQASWRAGMTGLREVATDIFNQK